MIGMGKEKPRKPTLLVPFGMRFFSAVLFLDVSRWNLRRKRLLRCLLLMPRGHLTGGRSCRRNWSTFQSMNILGWTCLGRGRA